MIRGEKILVTGAGGFLGANLVRRLIKEKSHVHAFVRKKSNLWRLTGLKNQIAVHFTDMHDISQLSALVERIKPDHIFHLAAHGAYPVQSDLQRMVQTNIIGTVNLLTSLSAIPYKSFINTGSSSEYGWKKSSMKESDLLEPRSFYAATKASTSLISQVFALTQSKPIITLRPFSVYGPWEESTRFVPTAMLALLNNSYIDLTPGNQRRDFIFVDDVIDAYLSASSMASQEPGKIFNVGTGEQYTNDELLDILMHISGKKLRVQKGKFPARSWDTSFWVADTTKAQNRLKWQAKHSLSLGLKKTYSWFKKNVKLYENIQ